LEFKKNSKSGIGTYCIIVNIYIAIARSTDRVSGGKNAAGGGSTS
jgi:hypothetical protein